MRSWIRQLIPWLLLLSLGANIYLGLVLVRRDQWVNTYLWGNTTARFFQQVNQGSLGVAPGSSLQSAREGLAQALESLHSLQYLPYYRERVDHGDWDALRRFISYAAQSTAAALREQSESGQVSERSRARLAVVREGLETILREGEHRRNELQYPNKAWAHAQWRQMWAAIAASLSRLEFIPLPE